MKGIENGDILEHEENCGSSVETTVYREIHCTPALYAGDQPVCMVLVVIHLREAQTGWRETDKKIKRIIRTRGHGGHQ